jgi:hypothetical protein
MRQRSLREEVLCRRDVLFDYRSGQAAHLQEMPSIPIDERRIREGVGFSFSSCPRTVRKRSNARLVP